jgi:hypothetical protein
MGGMTIRRQDPPEAGTQAAALRAQVPIPPEGPPRPVPPEPPPTPVPEPPGTPVEDPPGPDSPIPGDPDTPPAGDPPAEPPVRMLAAKAPPRPTEIGGPEGPEPTRYGDWERKGRVSDF